MPRRRSFQQESQRRTSRIKALAALALILGIGFLAMIAWALSSDQLGIALVGAVAGAMLLLILLIVAVISLVKAVPR